MRKSHHTGTTIERLTRIETLLEGAFGEDGQGGVIKVIRDDIAEVKRDVAKDVADLAALRNQGRGVLVGVAIAFTGLGVTAATWWNKIVAIFH